MSLVTDRWTLGLDLKVWLIGRLLNDVADFKKKSLEIFLYF